MKFISIKKVLPLKKLSFFLAISALLTSCAAGYNEIGSLGMLSDRHINPNTQWAKLAVAVGNNKKDIKASHAINMNEAIEQVLSTVPGAQYLTNVKIYAVNGQYIAVSGDVWGTKDAGTINKIEMAAKNNKTKAVATIAN